jgi:hypothetical protein
MNTFDTPVLRWGERSTLLPKRLFYAFSVQVEFELRADRAAAAGGRFCVPLTTRAQSGDAWSTYHVLREDLVIFPDGIVREVPRGRLRRGTGFMDIGQNDVGNLDGRLLLETDTGAVLVMSYSGVLTVTGGTARLLDAAAVAPPLQATRHGKAHIAVHCESEHTKHRWLIENQLFGFGHVTAVLLSAAGGEAATDAPAWGLAVTFDLYSAG